jgi:methionyl-tRNA formyltransferase
MKIFFITDNKLWFSKINSWRANRTERVEVYCSPSGQSLFEAEIDENMISPIDLKADYERLLGEFEIGVSCHCKQIFPRKLVEGIECFNFHPGLNPYNRGWFPQVFSILNGLPAGATIHRMDSQIDHGPIVAQQSVNIRASDTSKTVYDRVVEAEFGLFDHWIDKLMDRNYREYLPESEGNYNSISDFESLCEIDLNQKLSFAQAIDYLRAMTFEGYYNAYFYDEDGKKNFVSLNIEKDK